MGKSGLDSSESHSHQGKTERALSSCESRHSHRKVSGPKLHVDMSHGHLIWEQALPLA